MRIQAVCLAALSCTVLAQDPAKLTLLQSGYPRAFFFRHSEGFAARPNIEYGKWEKSFERLMGIEGKVLEEEVPGRSKRNIEFFTRFKKNHPDQLVMLHYNGNARDPEDRKGKYFAGHWLYYNGSKLSANIPAASGQSVLKVSDATLYLTTTGRYKNANEDVAICELDASGKPDWNKSEQLKLVSVDRRKNEITVLRGQYGTTPRAFMANKAYVAAHVTEGPWGKESRLLWDYNHSLACPRDPKGKSCDDVLIDELAAHFAPNGDLSAFDGLQFDVLKYGLSVRRGGKRGIDTNSDGEPDNGIVSGKDLYAAGTIDFCHRLRQRLGENRLILADGWSVGNQRAFGELNGIESEGWPSLTDYRVTDWTGGLNRQLFWVANSRSPVFNYVNHKFNIAGEIADGVSTDVPFSTHRLVFAGAVFTDSAICYSMRPPANDGELVGVWDELWMGAEHRLGWLGKPLGPAVHIALTQPSLAGVKLSAPEIADGQTSFRITALPPSASFLAFTARAAGSTARLIRIGASHGWINAREFRYVHSFEPGTKEVSIVVEGAGPVTITSLSVHAHPDAMYRQFEHGVVIANPDTKPYTFDLDKLFPGKRFHRIKGSPGQDTVVNNGSAVEDKVTLGPKDALFLRN